MSDLQPPQFPEPSQSPNPEPARAYVLNTPGLWRINQDAIRHNRNRQLAPEFFTQVDHDGIHLVVFQMLHNDIELRLCVMVKMADTMEPEEVFVDCALDLASLIQEVEIVPQIKKIPRRKARSRA